MMKTASIVAAVALLTFGWAPTADACPGSKGSNKTAQKSVPKDAQTVVLAVKGMSCGGCAARIASELQQVKGVYRAKIDYKNKRAKISFQPKTVTKAALIKKVAKMGYKVKVVKG